MSDVVVYLLGVVTLPVAVLLYAIGAVLVAGPGKVWAECRYCTFTIRPGRRPWWLWRWHRRREWKRHMRLSHTCRAKINGYNERNDIRWRYDERGRRHEVSA